MTMVNLTGNELEVWVNSKRTSFLIPEMTHGKKTFKEQDYSPVTSEDLGEDVGFKPATKTFLRAMENRPGYFHTGTNYVKIDQGGVPTEYEFEITGVDGQVLCNSETITITRSSFIVAAPNGKIWFQSTDTNDSGAQELLRKNHN